jgi:hypothetical protein
MSTQQASFDRSEMFSNTISDSENIAFNPRPKDQERKQPGLSATGYTFELTTHRSATLNGEKPDT